MKKYLSILFLCYLTFLLAGCAPKAVVAEKPLTELIQPETSPQKAASLRLTEEGKSYLQSGNLIKASEALEKAIAIDASNPYAYYYFAKLRYEKGEYKQSIGLLAKAEILFKGNPFYLSNVYSLMGRNYESLFQFNDARKRYEQALKLNGENTEAKEGMERIKVGN